MPKLFLLLLMGLISSITTQPCFSQGFGDSMGISPFWNWRTIETEHFRITFPKELEETANRTANYYEEAHSVLSKKLYWEARYRVQVLVVDNADAANGLTTPIGRFGMVLMVTPPDNWFSTYYYDDWLRLLVIHEYTHFLNMDATRGLWDAFRIAFGDVLLPNSIWPTWMLEGLAVYMETRLTQGGRGRSPYYEMVLRAAVKANALDHAKFITLDKINGDNPYAPSGETPYMFGFHLMNQVMEDSRERELTADRETRLDPVTPQENPNRGPNSGEDALGILSYRSANRVPFFINDNVENITGNDWYTHWKNWADTASKRVSRELEQISSQPLTRVEPLSQEKDEVFGASVSPDGKWIAYNQTSPDRRSGLYLKEIATGKSHRLGDKLLGVSIAFTPDSKAILTSAMHRKGPYYLWSDLVVFELGNEPGATKMTWITDSLRARDPDISQDGTKVVFTLTDQETTGLALAPLSFVDGQYRLGQVERIYTPDRYARASTPKFSPDGKRVVFSLHPSGSNREDLMSIKLEGQLDGPLADRQVSTLVQNGSYNRFPVFKLSGKSSGELFFVSDLTGIDNLYRLNAKGTPEQVTNLTTGILLPTFGQTFGQNEIYASIYTIDGWKLSRIYPSDKAIPSDSVRITLPESPKVDLLSTNQAKQIKHPVEDYSIFPSIWPRQWTPIIASSSQSLFIAGTVLGFDAVDRHRYLLGLGYETQIKKPDWLATYSNRSFGPTLTVSGSNQTGQIYYASDSSVSGYTRDLEFSTSLSYPFSWTYSSLTPSFSAHTERTSTYEMTSSGAPSLLGKSRYVPSFDALITYSGAETSRLAISPESGRVTFGGARLYVDSGVQIWKGLFVDKEYFRITKHSILTPSIKASITSRKNSGFTDSNVVTAGRVNRLIDSLKEDSFDELSIRGYPGVTIVSRAAGIGALDFRFPLMRVYRGLGTNPFFLENIFGFVFAENTYFPLSNGSSLNLPSIGGGLRAASELFVRVPLMFSLEYHRGFREEYGGKGELFLGLNLGTMLF